MSLTDWAAIIGALAWLPPVMGWLKKQLQLPEVTIITQPAPEIGFTSYGPICNLRLAFSVKNKDLVVTGLKLRITHESGEARIFEWRGITQKMGHMTYPEIGAVPIEKEANVLAIKLIDRDIEERFVRFQEELFLRGKSEIAKAISKKYAFRKQQGKLDLDDFLTSSEEMADLYAFIRQSFCWRAGSYSMRFILESPERFKVVDDAYEFSMSPVDISQLEINKDFIESAVKNEVNPAAPAVEESAAVSTVAWNWIYPELRKCK